MPACMALFSQATLRRWFTHTCVDRTRFMLSESFCGSFATAVGCALKPVAIPEDGGRFALRADQLDLVAARFEQRDGIRRKAALHPQLVGEPLMMEAGPVDCLLDVHPEVEHVDHYFEHRIDDGRTAGRAYGEIEFAVAQDDGWRHGREWMHVRPD